MSIMLIQYFITYIDYKLSKGICLYSPNNGKDCCLSFNSNSKCTQCTGGLQPNPTTGICEDVKLEGCIKKATLGCEICARNYDLVNRKCIPSIPKCTKYDQDMNCIACHSSCLLINGSCVPLIKINKIPNCKVSTEYGCG